MQVPEDSTHADSDGLLHGVLNVTDLAEKSVETWINEFSGATHLCDIYANRRVDKRKAFPSQYKSLPHMMQELGNSAPVR